MRSGVDRPMVSKGQSTQNMAESVRPSDETRAEFADGVGVKKATPLVVEEVELDELHRLLIDNDARAALEWIRRHLRGKTLRLLEGGRRVRLQVPGSGIASPPR
jgi:hypothetical protein